ncbi:MAG: family 10 glycosylhydrolase [Candidatus Promineifilaceae bacterium]|nr:family 10 glycosylhydrolase [Candidatus Promineifilaceae bacterium]
MRRYFQSSFSAFSLILLLALAAGAEPLLDGFIYLPYTAKAAATPTPTSTPTPTPTVTPSPTATIPPNAMVEVRALWITRFDWTLGVSPAEQPAYLESLVDKAAAAGFNTLLFQVRGAADAFYTPGLEPWSKRLSGTLGQNPGWDPLQRVIDRAHAGGLQVHAYINVYPVWDDCQTPPPHTSPEHLYHLLDAEYRDRYGPAAALQWTNDDNVHCSGYWRATPASFFVDEHLMNVTKDLVERYDIDGVHLDHIRYGGSNTSCDPVSEARAGGECFQVRLPDGASYGDWQRRQVNGTVSSFYRTLFGNEGVADKPNLMLSGAVWPYYESGYSNYYQDSKAWLAGGYIDALMPMLYGSFDDSPEIWRDYAAGFQAANAGRFVIPGIHGAFFGGEEGTFEDIAARIEAARQLGTAGHAIFSSSYLDNYGYFDDLANGPYIQPAVPPTISWHP